MALEGIRGITQKIGQANRKVNLLNDSGKLEKAVFYTHLKGFDKTEKYKIPVQFNPSELQISRRTRLSGARALSRDTDPKQLASVRGELSMLSLTLYFDTYSVYAIGQSLFNSAVTLGENLAGGIQRRLSDYFLNSERDEEAKQPSRLVLDVLNIFGELIRFDKENHQTPGVRFVWGDHFSFVGKVEQSTVRYTMFGRDGTPVRAALQLSILGEEYRYVSGSEQNPFESPDRTKERQLPYGEQLWQLAGEEYGDPGKWKVIAGSNGILNPRTIEPAARLKLPAIR